MNADLNDRLSRLARHLDTETAASGHSMTAVRVDEAGTTRRRGVPAEQGAERRRFPGKVLSGDRAEEPTVPNKKSNVKNEKQYEALKDKGTSKERAAKIANSPGASKKGGQKSGSESSSKSSSKQGGTTQQKKEAGRKGGKAAAKKS